jgi:L-lactate utilization protein LutB
LANLSRTETAEARDTAEVVESWEIAIERAVSHSVPKTYETLAKCPYIQQLAPRGEEGKEEVIKDRPLNQKIS